jgi:hypothetical protein
MNQVEEGSIVNKPYRTDSSTSLCKTTQTRKDVLHSVNTITDLLHISAKFLTER